MTWSLVYASSAKLVSSWKNPKYAGERFHRILVIGMSENPVVRADFERCPLEQLTRDGLEAVPGNTILLRPDSPEVDMDYLKGQIHDHKIDDSDRPRMVNVDRRRRTCRVRVTHFLMPTMVDFTVITERFTAKFIRRATTADTTVRIETNFLFGGTADEDLIWTGVSDSFNPKNADKAIGGLVKMVIKRLEKEEILSKNAELN